MKTENKIDELISMVSKNLKRYSPPENLWMKIEKKLLEEELVKSKKKISIVEIIKKLSDRIKFPELNLGWTVATSFAVIFIALISVVSVKYFASDNDVLSKVESELKGAEKKYLKAINELEKLAEANKDNVDPHLYALYSERLALIDESIKQCQRALNENYLNLNAQRFLLSAYNQKIETLRLMLKPIQDQYKSSKEVHKDEKIY